MEEWELTHTATTDAPDLVVEPADRVVRGVTPEQLTPNLAEWAESFSCIWVPQPDITAHELATILPYLIGGRLDRDAWEALGDAKRHLVPHDDRFRFHTSTPG